MTEATQLSGERKQGASLNCRWPRLCVPRLPTWSCPEGCSWELSPAGVSSVLMTPGSKPPGRVISGPHRKLAVSGGGAAVSVVHTLQSVLLSEMVCAKWPGQAPVPNQVLGPQKPLSRLPCRASWQSDVQDSELHCRVCRLNPLSGN